MFARRSTAASEASANSMNAPARDSSSKSQKWQPASAKCASRERAREVGPTIEAAVAGGVNAGFAQARANGLDLVVWERGAGLTDACGTGACAAAVASIRAGKVKAGAPVEVRLPGGALEITVSADLARVTMRGPAERVFEGEAEL